MGYKMANTCPPLHTTWRCQDLSLWTVLWSCGGWALSIMSLRAAVRIHIMNLITTSISVYSMTLRSPDLLDQGIMWQKSDDWDEHGLTTIWLLAHPHLDRIIPESLCHHGKKKELPKWLVLDILRILVNESLEPGLTWHWELGGMSIIANTSQCLLCARNCSKNLYLLTKWILTFYICRNCGKERLSNPSKIAELAKAGPGYGTQAVKLQNLCLSFPWGRIYIHQMLKKKKECTNVGWDPLPSPTNLFSGNMLMMLLICPQVIFGINAQFDKYVLHWRRCNKCHCCTTQS